MALVTQRKAKKQPFISSGLGHTAAVLESGELVMWGMSRQHQLGLDRLTEKEKRNGKTEADLPPPEDRHSPEVVPHFKMTGDKIATVACGSSHTLAVNRNGVVFSWGSAAFGKLGRCPKCSRGQFHMTQSRSMPQPEDFADTALWSSLHTMVV